MRECVRLALAIVGGCGVAAAWYLCGPVTQSDCATPIRDQGVEMASVPTEGTVSYSVDTRFSSCEPAPADA